MQRIAASPTDVFSHHLSRESETRMTLVMRTAQRLDGDRMLQAIGMLMQHEPIFRCRMEHEGEWFVWNHLPDLEPAAVLREHGIHPGDEAFCFGAMDTHKAPLWDVNISHGDVSTFAFSMAHALGDGRALIAATDLLLAFYLGFKEPVKAQILPDRSLDPLLDGSGRGATPSLDGPFASWPSMYMNLERDEKMMTSRSVDEKGFNNARAYWKTAASATVNDFLLAATLMALRDMTGEGADARISATVDNRSKAASPVPEIANFSSNFAIGVGDIRGANMNEVVKRVSTRMRELKEDGRLGLDDLELFAGIRTSKGMDHLIDLMYSAGTEGRALYFITNVGEIRLDQRTMDALGPTEAYMAYPGIRPPTVGIVASSFRGRLNLNMGHYAGLPTSKAEQLLAAIEGHMTP